MKDLSIIIVNWNSLAFTTDSIASIYATVDGLDFEVIVVDNASRDGDCRSLVEAFPAVKLILSPLNIGFGRANMLGVDHSEGRNLLFLNPDTMVLGDAISQMVSQLDSTPDIGAVGCRLLNADRSLQTSCVQAFPTALNQLLGLNWIKRTWPHSRLWGMRVLYIEGASGVHDVEVISGACLMVRAENFKQVGGFSSDYFMYAEEVDLCYAIRRAGWRVVYVADVHVVHFGGQSTKKRGDSFADVMMRDSVFTFLLKHRGRCHASLYRFGLFISAVLRLSILITLVPFTVVSNPMISRRNIFRASSKWLNVARWSLSLD
jgi:GT2 family glycosyltransferase